MIKVWVRSVSDWDDPMWDLYNTGIREGSREGLKFFKVIDLNGDAQYFQNSSDYFLKREDEQGRLSDVNDPS